MRPDRRLFLAAAGAFGLAPRLGWADAGEPSYLAAAGTPDGAFLLIGLGGDGAERFRIPLPGRGHAAAAHPHHPEAVAFARRPGTFALVLDCATGRVTARLAAPDGRAFQGHGAFTADGARLLTTETAEEGRGVIGLWDAAGGYRRIGEVASGGIGPHEILRMPDDTRFAVANGGIATDPSSGRAPLNLATMQPNLAWLDAATGALVQVLDMPPDLRLNSLRHLAAGRDGTLAAALQWEGAELDSPPLLALHRPGASALTFRFAPPQAQRRTRNYGGSVAVSNDGLRAAVTAPRGGLMLDFDLATEGVSVLAEPDVCGVAACADGFALSTGEGRFLAPSCVPVTHAGLAFDNHLVRIG